MNHINPHGEPWEMRFKFQTTTQENSAAIFS